MVVVKRKTLSFSEKLYLPEIFKGMSMTFRAMFKPRVTRQYPEEPLPTNEVTRGQPRLATNDEDGSIRCVSCGLCEVACPAYAITIDGQDTERSAITISGDVTEKFIEREPKEFEIDMLRCILCGFCEEACPKDAIFMSDELELADFTRKDLIYGLDKLKRPVSQLRPRIDYIYKVNERWQASSSTR
jgi:NADH-quinone oxidoreductase subunit I